MTNRRLEKTVIAAFLRHLQQEEKVEKTCQKYVRDASAFMRYAGTQAVTKELVCGYKKSLMERGFAVSSVNSMLASVNALMTFLGWQDCRVKHVRQQRQIYCPEEKELSKGEYLRLLEASRGNRQLNLILQTICATGIRVSELQFFTVEAVRGGAVTVSCKSKTRQVFLPGKLRKLLLEYAKTRKICQGPVFLGKTGKPLDRSRIWAMMKGLCTRAKVAPGKVFPHNLRKLFARTFYTMEKDISKLADLLGHSSINTTRIYIMTTGQEHRKKIERLGLVI